MARKFAYLAFALLVVSSSLLLAQQSNASAMREYRSKLAKANPTTADAHYELAVWAFENNLDDVTKTEINAALALQKDHMPSLLLLRRLEEKLASQSTSQPTTSTSRPTSTPVITMSDLDKNLVSDEDINHIRIQELRKDDVVAIDFKNDILDRFLKVMRGRAEFDTPQSADAFKVLSPVAKACRIRQEFPDDYSWLDDIVIKSDPKFMVDFRSRVWPVVSQQCATSGCHGGDKGNGGYRLFNMAFKNERLDYTNFVILDGVQTSSGGRLVDRDRSEDSLILQFGLPTDQARVHHPKPIPVVFPSRGFGTYRAINDWVQSLAAPPHPNYALKYNLPVLVQPDVAR
jgi:hypothetical protein